VLPNRGNGSLTIEFAFDPHRDLGANQGHKSHGGLGNLQRTRARSARPAKGRAGQWLAGICAQNAK